MSSPTAPQPTVVLDCRWLGNGGPGRTTELVLRALGAHPPAGRWVLWGDEGATGPFAWPEAELAPRPGDPRSLMGQRHAYDVPKGDLIVYMHQVRPFRNLPCITMIYDTIPLRHGTNRVLREAKRLFLRNVAARSRQILTISAYSRQAIIRDLGASPDRVHVLRFPFDGDFVERVHRLRPTVGREDVALFIGGFLPHKNLPRLLQAFENTTFRREGGRLVVAGGTAQQVAEFTASLTPSQRRFVEVRAISGQSELDRLFASSLLLVQPSLEEGFGLPAWEALCCGLPVCASDGGALPEVVQGFAQPFPATSVPAMTTAIDESAARAKASTEADLLLSSHRVRESAPTLQAFGDQFRSIIEQQTLAFPPAQAKARAERSVN